MTDRTTYWSALLAGLLLLAFAGGAVAAEGNGDLPGLEGGKLTRAELSKGDTVIVVWASWSPRSRDLGTRVAALTQRWKDRARVVTVNFQESPEKARAFVAQQGMKAPVYLDRDAVFAKRHAVTSLPYLLIFSEGKLGFSGKLPADPDAVIARTLG